MLKYLNGFNGPSNSIAITYALLDLSELDEIRHKDEFHPVSKKLKFLSFLGHGEVINEVILRVWFFFLDSPGLVYELQGH